MLAYKFLSRGAVGLYSGFRWPVGEWVEIEGPLVPSRRGIHACRLRDLSHWIDDELWLAELEGGVLEAERMIVASRGRLVEPVPFWNAELAREFARASVARCGEHPGLVEDAEYWDYDPPSSAYMAARAAGLASERAGEGYAAGFARERAWQAAWLAERLGLNEL